MPTPHVEQVIVADDEQLIDALLDASHAYEAVDSNAHIFDRDRAKVEYRDARAALLTRLSELRSAALAVSGAGADTKRLDYIDDSADLWYRLRPGRNNIGVANGGWLLTHGRIGEGPESKHFDIRAAIDAARGAAACSWCKKSVSDCDCTSRDPA